MNHITRITIALTGLAAAALALAAGSPAAFATREPPGGDGGAPASAPPQVHTVITGGMPGWQITLIAVTVALLAAVAAVFLDRAWAARRHTAAPSA
jgi:hypothetical protein